MKTEEDKITTVSQDLRSLWNFIPKWAKYGAAIMLFIYIVIAAFYYKSNPLGPELLVNGKTIKLLVAVTPDQKQKGLGYRSSMPEDTGMVFPFDTKEKHGFWMKGMQFPLDFVWIDGNTIADITENVLPPASDGPLQTVSPKVPVDKVLELNAGQVAKLGLKVGDTVKFRTN